MWIELILENCDNTSFNLKFVGVHPHDAKSWDETSLESLKEIAQCPECVAIGECGLDFNRNFSPQDVQLKVFEEQVSKTI